MQSVWAGLGSAPLRVGEQQRPSGGERADPETKHRERLNSAWVTEKARAKQGLQDNQVSRMKGIKMYPRREGIKMYPRRDRVGDSPGGKGKGFVTKARGQDCFGGRQSQGGRGLDH